jgi:hypothetical protein
MKSSYSANEIGEDITNIVSELRPRVSYEFGVYEGYSTLAILRGISQRWGIRQAAYLNAFDLWEDYEYNHGDLEEVRGRLYEYDVYGQLYIDKGDFYEWIKDMPPHIDFLHLDISNDGDVIETAVEGLPSGTHLLFEGGSDERDNVDWMIKYNKRPIQSIKYKYEIINNKFPSISYLRVP